MVTQTDIQIRFADVDILGHVNNVNIQHFFDLGKSDYFRRVLGIDLNWKKRGLITASTHTSYIAQTRMEDRVYVETNIEKVGTKSLTIYQRLIGRELQDLRAESRTVLVTFDFEDQQSVPVPDQWRDFAAE